MAIVRLCEVPAGLSLGRLVGTHQKQRKREMRKSTTDRMNDYDAVVMGVLEPTLLLLFIAVTEFSWACSNALR